MEITKECQFKGKMRKIGAGADGMVYENCSNGKCHIVKETPKLYGDQEIIMIQKLMGLKK